jgi:hypothetical protein
MSTEKILHSWEVYVVDASTYRSARSETYGDGQDDLSVGYGPDRPAIYSAGTASLLRGH